MARRHDPAHCKQSSEQAGKLVPVLEQAGRQEQAGKQEQVLDKQEQELGSRRTKPDSLQ